MTESAPVDPKGKPLSVIAAYSMTGSVAILALMHFIEPQFDPTWRFISEYSLGNAGFLMKIAFAFLGIGQISFAVSALVRRRKWWDYLAAAILVIAGVGSILACIFNTDPITTPIQSLSESGKMHVFGASLGYTPIALMIFSFSQTVGSPQKWKRTVLVSIAGAGVLLTVLFMLSMPADLKFGQHVFTGLIGRFLVASYAAWFICFPGSLKLG